ncbi:MAG: tRNA (N6-isopentenyl adenosine(37)-C2)-methylthiotransferase MiaB [Candidatus Eisenbacteria bacterium]|nr:tRNA (N6-isopentenyl adenosine(37)-C2)-methylthiotransferase MiaB [Candidatus Eisenbacteria bacterium]
METYGCQMNEYDSGMIRAMLESSGHTFVPRPEDADVVIVNTCSVRERAERRVLGRLRHLRGLLGRDAALGVVGCVAQRMGGLLMREVRGLGFVVGTDSYSVLPEAVERAGEGVATIETETRSDEIYDRRPAPSRAGLCEFVSVARGCDNFCSYCIVPHVRGRERSRPADAVVREVEALSRLGAREVTLLGQNVNSYADGETDFARLLERVSRVDAVSRVRFATSHPKDLTERLVDAVSRLPEVCEHVHLPVQSGSDRTLRAMNRGYTRRRYLELASLLRKRVPGVALTTDVIVGFPGETERDFEDTLSLLEEVRFDSAFMFRYSVREGTAAAALADDVPEPEKIQRLERVIETQKRITSELNERLVGEVLEVLLEGPSERNPEKLFGRTRTGKAVVAPAPRDLSGELVGVRITEASAWTLHGEVVEGAP